MLHVGAFQVYFYEGNNHLNHLSVCRYSVNRLHPFDDVIYVPQHIRQSHREELHFHYTQLEYHS